MAEGPEPRPVIQRAFGEIEGYKIKRLIGKGGMGAVYLARQVSMDRDVALKVLLPALAKDKEFVTRFVREARAAGKLQHANIVSGIDVGESGGYYYFAMEYVEGTPVSEILKKRGRIPEANALGITMRMARALEHAWNHQLIHRDIKPSNIMITKGGTAKLMDLGLARSAHEDMAVTLTGTAIGTPHYISPEQARGERDLDTRTDIYSLGATLYHMATGVVPFDGDTAAVVMTKHLSEKLPSPRSKNPHLSPGICRLIEKMMAKEPSDRYATPAELIRDVARVARGGVPVGVKTKQAEDGEAKPRRRESPAPRKFSPELFWGTVVAGVILIGIVAFLLTRGGPEEVGPVQPPPAADRPPKSEELKEMFEYAQKWEKEHLEDYEGAARKYTTVLERAAGTVWEMKAQDAIEQIRARVEKKAAEEFERMEKKALGLAAKGDYDGAIAAYSRLPKGFEKILGPAAQQAAARQGKEAESKIVAVAERASRLSKEGRPAEALEELEKISGVKFAPYAARIAEFRTRLETEKKDAAEIARKRAEAAAKKKFEAVWDDFDKRLFSEDYAGAKALLERARADREFEATARALDALAGLLGEFDAAKEARKRAAESLQTLVGKDVVLETVKGAKKGRVREVSDGIILLRREYRINNQVGWSEEKVPVSSLLEEEKARLMPVSDPATPRGWLARAIVEMGRGNVAGAEAAYEGAKEHSLAPRYGGRLDALKLGEAEAAAKGYWQKNLAPHLSAVQLSEARAKEIEEHLKHFIESYGETDFVGSVGRHIAALRRKIAEALGAKELEALRKIFRGEVVRFDPKTLEVELLYDFAGTAQMEDWQFRGMPPIHRCSIEHGVLRTSGPATGIVLKAPIVLGSVTFEISQDPVDILQFGVDQHAVAAMRGQQSVLADGFNIVKLLAGNKAARGLRGGMNKLELSTSGREGTLAINGKKLIGPVGEPRRGHLLLRTWNANRIDNVRVVGNLDRRWLERATKIGAMPAGPVGGGKARPEGKGDKQHSKEGRRKMSPEERAERLRRLKEHWEKGPRR